MAERRARVRIEGRVQGVFFRDSTRREAERLQVKGWVTNLDNGDVEAVLQGEAAQVEQLIQWCHRGPRAARVDQVTVTDETPQDDLHGFRVEH